MVVLEVVVALVVEVVVVHVFQPSSGVATARPARAAAATNVDFIFDFGVLECLERATVVRDY